VGADQWSRPHRVSPRRGGPARRQAPPSVPLSHLLRTCFLMMARTSLNDIRRHWPSGSPMSCCNSFSHVPFLIGLLALSGCTYLEPPSEPARHLPKQTKESSKYQHKEVDKASWYGPGLQNKRTASGEIFDQNKLTAGSRRLPFGTVVEVTNLKNGKRVEVKINDRGPWVRGRTIDLSRAAAKKLGMIKTGVAPVEIRIIASGKSFSVTGMREASLR
jgi:rare lipoprotein A